MDLYLDTADVEAIRRASRTGLLAGVTTNPSHIAKTKRTFTEVVEEIVSLPLGHVSVEAVGTSTEDLVAEAERMAAFGPQVVVKIPMTAQGMAAVSILEERKIPTNVTMCFSPTQSFLAMKAGASYVSIVLGRLERIAHESEPLIQDTMAIKCAYGFPSRIIAGSIKSIPTVLSCLRAGVDIATVPESIFFQLFEHPLTDAALAQFEEDWKTVR
jgi:transaldolase